MASNNQDNFRGIPINKNKEAFVVPAKNDDRAYQEIAQFAPVRKIENMPTEPGSVPADGTQAQTGGVATMSQQLTDTADLTDLQFIIQRMFPRSRMTDPQVNEVEELLPISRIDSEVFLPLLHLQVENEIMMTDPNKAINVEASIARNYGRETIGLDGRGRIEYVGFGGASIELKKQQMGGSNLGGLP